MKRESVNSSTFVSIGYDSQQRLLETEFQNGGVYQYFDVPAGIWQGFRQADSKGRFFAWHIRDHYGYRRVG